MGSWSYVDDASIPDGAELWRRVHPKWVVADENTGQQRVSSAAFDDSRDGSPLSVLLAEIVRQTGRSWQDVLSRFPGYGLVSLTAGSARGCGQGIARTPEPEEPAHASVFGRKTSATKRTLAHAAHWLAIPPAQ